MNGIKRQKAVVQAAIDDLYFDMLNDWDIQCRAMSSTGENMVRESLMDHDMYQDFLNRLRVRATMLVAKRLEEK